MEMDEVGSFYASSPHHAVFEFNSITIGHILSGEVFHRPLWFAACFAVLPTSGYFHL